MVVPEPIPIHHQRVLKKLIRRAFISHGITIPTARVDIYSGWSPAPPYEYYYGWVDKWTSEEEANRIAGAVKKALAPFEPTVNIVYSNVTKKYLVYFNIPSIKVREYIRQQGAIKSLMF